MNAVFRSLCLAALMVLSTTASLAISSFEESTQTSNTSSRSLACSGDICLNEALPNPNGYDDASWPGGEWMEIHNSGTTTVDVRDWYLTNKASKTLYFNSTSIVDYDAADSTSWEIEPDEYMVIARNGLPNSIFYFANTNDIISLYTDGGVQLDQATWTFSSSGAPSGTSLEEDSSSPTNDWVATNGPSPGAINSGGSTGGPTVYPSDLVINEVMSNPWPSNDNATWPGGEWVEVFNSGNTDMDLTGWSVQDAAGNILDFDSNHLIGSAIIGAGETRIVAVNGSGSSGVLNNGVETLSLHWPNGTKAQQITWTDTEAGFSLVEDPSSQYWTYAAYPTPNASNPSDFSLIVTTPSTIEFAELLSNSSSDGSAFPDGEWIELLNTGTTTVDLTGWSVIDGMGNVTYLDPGSLVFNQSQGATSIDAEERRLIQFNADTELWNYYNHLMLRDSTGLIVDSAWYTTDYGQNISLVPSEIENDPWVPSTWMTPGQPDPGETPSTGLVIFTEVYPDGVGSDSQQWPLGEWLEIYNNGTTALDVGGWKLQSSGRSLTLHQYNMPLQATSMIQPGEVALIALNGTTSFYLKHTTPDSIILIDGDGNMVDSISWVSTTEGESLIAPNSTHAGAGPLGTGASNGSDWIQSAWATPGVLNPIWPAYSDSSDLAITEILAYCNDDSINPLEDWIEVMNVGTSDLNMSRWRIDSNDGDRRFFRTASMWNQSDDSMILAPQERAVLLMENNVISGLGDQLQLSDPDGNPVLSAQWNIVSDCQTMGPGDTEQDGWQLLLWPTPGYEEPDASLFAEAEDIVISRFMPEGSTTLSSNTEFVEISNIGDSLAYMGGWVLTLINSANEATDYIFDEVTIPSDGSVLLAADPSGLSVYEDGTIIGFDIAMSATGLTLPDSGATLQIKTPTGILADTVAYGNGPVEVEGWSGISLAEPVSSLSLLVYHRGDGCGNLPDTDVALDWQHRWGRLGASTFCGPTVFSGTSTITPLVGPQDGLVDLVAWVDNATESLHVHLYQIEQPNLVQALIEAHNRGVDVTVVLNAAEYWWNNYDKDNQIGVANLLATAGIDTFWFGGQSDEPYAYIHSKVAVKDNESVWIGSGNWKSSSQPAPDERGNSEWGVLVDNTDLAQKVMNQLAYDESSSRTYITQVYAGSAPSGWSLDALKSLVNGTLAEPITTDVSGRLITCPDTCVDGLVWMIEQADEEILLSLQYLDVDWSWGWGDNPIVSALEDAAQSGVRIRLIINGAYLDKDIQEVVDTFNEEWNTTLGYDINAIIMSEDDEVSKLHNKGVIVDAEHVLISSINWGDSAPTRNREMGLILSSQEVSAPFLAGWHRDWIRTDNVTDSDNDGLPDYWEVANGLNRTTRTLPILNILEGSHDADGDGLLNEVEYEFGSHATNADTDGDCIPDSIEVTWAQSTALNSSIPDVSPTAALTLADADGDGVNESDVLGCDLGGILSDDNQTTIDNGSLDDDGDMVINRDDTCPNTMANIPVDVKGCSTEQRNANASPSADTSSDFGTKMMLAFMIGGMALAAGAFFILRNIKTEGEEIKDLITLDSENQAALAGAEIDAENWEMPVLDGSGGMPTPSGLSPEDLARCPGWPEETIQSYLDQGWTIDQLADYYQEQVDEHA
ncbi:MAG TPA: lamin tail domain-containing protein [Candidatus Poseidoniaceae archaeon]|nr:lamin tail domain-containing protein [Candidatus Poseidoniaceae archaeon]